MNDKPVESTIFKNTPAPQRFLVAFAHPDDESFGPAGTLIRYAKSGVAVHYVCATRGEAGSVDPQLMDGRNSLGELRTQELLCAAKSLRLTGLHFLNYRDSGMENSQDNQHPDSLIQAPLEEVTEKITRLIREIKPQVVLTFDPSGGYFHPDHVYMHRAATLAFHAAGDPSQFPHHLDDGLEAYQPQKLYYTVFPRGLVKFAVKVLPLFGKDPAAFGRNKDINLKRVAAVKQIVTAKIKVSPYFDAGQSAAACHDSQIGGGLKKLPKFIQKWFSRYEYFTRVTVHPPPASASPRNQGEAFKLPPVNGGNEGGRGERLLTRVVPPANNELESDLFTGIKLEIRN